jgi:hypothetical protein
LAEPRLRVRASSRAGWAERNAYANRGPSSKTATHSTLPARWRAFSLTPAEETLRHRSSRGSARQSSNLARSTREGDKRVKSIYVSGMPEPARHLVTGVAAQALRAQHLALKPVGTPRACLYLCEQQRRTRVQAIHCTLSRTRFPTLGRVAPISMQCLFSNGDPKPTLCFLVAGRPYAVSDGPLRL